MKQALNITLTISLTLLIFLTAFLSFSFNPTIQKLMINQISQEDDAINKHIRILEFFNTNEMKLDMSPAELLHMQDVRDRYLQVIGIIFILSFFLLINHKYLKTTFKYQKYSSYTLATITILTYIFSNQLFVLFHKIFFAQGNWQFSASSQLIRLYPQEYFITLAIVPLILTIIYCYLISILSKSAEHRKENSQ